MKINNNDEPQPMDLDDDDDTLLCREIDYCGDGNGVNGDVEEAVVAIRKGSDAAKYASHLHEAHKVATYHQHTFDFSSTAGLVGSPRYLGAWNQQEFFGNTTRSLSNSSKPWSAKKDDNTDYRENENPKNETDLIIAEVFEEPWPYGENRGGSVEVQLIMDEDKADGQEAETCWEPIESPTSIVGPVGMHMKVGDHPGACYWQSHADFVPSPKKKPLGSVNVADSVETSSSIQLGGNIETDKEIERKDPHNYEKSGNSVSDQILAAVHQNLQHYPGANPYETSRKLAATRNKQSAMRQKHELDDLGSVVQEMMNQELQRGEPTSKEAQINSKPDPPAFDARVPENEPRKVPPEQTIETATKTWSRAWVSRKETLENCRMALPIGTISSHITPLLKPVELTKEICIVYDGWNAGMDKFIPPLVSNLEKFCDLLSPSANEKLRMSLVMHCATMKFTSCKSKFLSFARDAVRKRERLNGMPSAISPTLGLSRSLSSVKGLDWRCNSERYIYIFTNMSYFCGDNSDGDRKKESLKLRGLARHLPVSAEILIGRWRNDNDAFLESLRTKKRHPKTFPFLDVKKMASFVVPDKDVLERRFRILKQTDRTPTLVSIHTDESILSKKSSMFPLRKMHKTSNIQRATRHQYKPPTSVQEVLSNVEPILASRTCSVNFESTMTGSHDMYFSRGTVFEEGKSKYDVMLKFCKIDIINDKLMMSHALYRQKAIVSAQAIFLSREYNKDYRPDHCAKIYFLRGCFIDESVKNVGGRAFYAEEFVSGAPEFVEFCDAAGNWNAQRADESLLRFAQTCFKLSGGDFMVTGLKGVRRAGIFVLKLPSLLTRTCSDPYASQCNKEYMTACRKGAKALLEKNDWKK